MRAYVFSAARVWRMCTLWDELPRSCSIGVARVSCSIKATLAFGGSGVRGEMVEATAVVASCPPPPPCFFVEALVDGLEKVDDEAEPDEALALLDVAALAPVEGGLDNESNPKAGPDVTGTEPHLL
jgi:hypothetical protein